MITAPLRPPPPPKSRTRRRASLPPPQPQPDAGGSALFRRARLLILPVATMKLTMVGRWGRMNGARCQLPWLFRDDP
jgi:hypothetical protein